MLNKTGLKIDGNNSTLKEGLQECEKAMNKPSGQGLFGPQIWQTISLDPELRPFMSDKDFVNKVNMLNALSLDLILIHSTRNCDFVVTLHCMIP